MGTTEPKSKELNEMIEQRIAALIQEMEEADWQMEEVVLAINTVIQSRWMDRLGALREARSATPTNFVSDGNDG
jgi:hypothetical protein